MSKVDELKAYLEAMGTRIGGLFPGTNPMATDEEIAGAILASLKEIERRAQSGPAHSCPEWDGLDIFPCDPEMDACTCDLKELLR